MQQQINRLPNWVDLQVVNRFQRGRSLNNACKFKTKKREPLAPFVVTAWGLWINQGCHIIFHSVRGIARPIDTEAITTITNRCSCCI